MDDLVKRLRSGTTGNQTWLGLCDDAADRIEALEAQLATTPSPEAVAKAALEYIGAHPCLASDPAIRAAIIKTAGGKKDE
jgi:hypothetical protein